MENLKNKKVAIIATDGFEETELTEPKRVLESHGAETHVIALSTDAIKGWKDGNWSIDVDVDLSIHQANADNYDALVIPGGVINPDKLRRNSQAVDFVREFFKQHKPVAAICHGPQILIEADVVNGRKMTSFSSIRKDLENAGANWVDQDVVVDEALVTSRSPKDMDAFTSKMVEEIAEGKHAEQTA